MERLMLVLLVTLLTNGEALPGKTAGRNVDGAVITAEVKTKVATDQAAATLRNIAADTNRARVSLNGTSPR